MQAIYHLEYEESEEVFEDIFFVNSMQRHSYMYKVIVLLGGALLLFIGVAPENTYFSLFYYSGVVFRSEVGSKSFLLGNGILPIVVFLFLWLLVYLMAYMWVRNVAPKYVRKWAKRKGEKYYNNRKAKLGAGLQVTIDFYKEYFVISSHNSEIKYTYFGVTKLFETDNVIGAIAGGVRENKRRIGFAKSGLAEIGEQEFKKFLLKCCINVAQNRIRRY